MREELRAFIVERLLDLDPTLSDAAGSAIYSKVVDPLIARLGTDPLSVDIQEFILSRLQDEYPNADYRSPGSALRDLFVSPLVMLLEPLKAEIDFLRKQRSVVETEALTEDELDAILENVFAVRKTGAFSLAMVRMYFTTARAFSVDSSIIFSTADGVEFVAQQPQNFLANQFNRSGNLYYVDVPVRSVLATAESNVAINEIRLVRNVEGVVRVTNLAPSTGGVTRETNDEFIVRAERAISERSLNTQRGTETNLRNTFEDLVSIDVVGYGDPEMQRDILQGTSSVSVELPGALLFTTANFTTLSLAAGLPVTNKLSITDANGSLPVSAGNFIRVSDLNGDFTDPLLSRPRKIAAANYANGSWTVTLSDFTAYLSGGTAMFTLSNQALTGNPATSTRIGFNEYARQGSAYRLFGTDNGVDYLAGSPLPFDEAVKVDGFESSGPSDVLPGRDFLIVQSPTGAQSGTTTVKCHPINRRPVASVLTLSRLDSFLTDKRRILYQGKELYTHPAGVATTLESEGVNVVAFGAPAFNKTDATRYDGKTIAPYGRSPGAKLGPYAQGGANPPDDRTILAEGSVLRWDTTGALVGDYIAVTLYGDLVGQGPAKYDGALSTSGSQLIWHAWGRITSVSVTSLTVTGLDYEPLVNQAEADYRLAWTIYRNELEAIAPDGTKVTSYSDQMLVPAFRVPVLANTNDPAHHPFPATYKSDGTFTSLDPVNRALAWQNYNNGTFRGAWIRLEQDFTTYLAGVANIPTKPCTTAVKTLLNSSDLPSNFNRHRYSMKRFGVAVVNDQTPHIWSVLASPLSDGSRFVLNPTGTITIGTNPNNTSNPRGHGGFLLPPNLGAPLGVKQILQVFSQADLSQSVTGGIVVSGIPSSIPLPDLLPAPQIVESDKVHIGGMTDVYIKPSTSSSDLSDPIKFQPADLVTEVLAEGSDGAIAANALTVLSSPTLETALKQLLGIGANDYGGADNLVVELLNPPQGLTPTFFRILHNTGNGAKIDGTFSNASVGLRWRLIRDCSVNLSDPVIVYKSGTDLKMSANSTSAYSAGGFGLTLLPGLVLRVLTGPNAGEYVVSDITANDVSVTTVFASASEGASYQLLLRQASGLSMPLIRVTNVNLSGNLTGVTVPYRHPVDAVSSSFAGVNDDPFTSVSGILEKVAGVLELRSTTSFQSKGVVAGDVVRLEDVEEPHKYYRVIEVVAQPNQLQEYALKLDRVPVNAAGQEVFVGKITGVEFTVGHPSIGTADLLFLSPTMVEVDQDTVFSYTAATGKISKFRPTTQESAVMYQTGQTEVGFAVTKVVVNQVTTYEFSSTSVNFLGLGLKPSDRVEFLTKVLRSGAHASATTNLAIVGKELVLEIDDVRYVIVMTGAVNTTLSGAANDINNQTGGRVFAKITQVNNDFFLDIVSTASVSVLAESSAGLLGAGGALKFDVSNNSLGGSPTGVIDKIEYNTNTDTVKVTVGSVVGPQGWTPPAASIAVSIRVRRDGVQRFLPADMVQQDTGLYSVQVKLSSYDPFTQDQLLTQQSMTVDGYRSLGYELLTKDSLYSYSLSEEPLIRVTPIVLPSTADSLTTAYPLPGAIATIAYDWSPTVSAVQNYMLQPAIRVANHNPLVRHFLPAYPVINIQYRGPTTLTADVVTAKVQEYLTTLYPNRPLELFDLVAVLERAGATFVQFPQQAAFLTYDANRVARLIRSDNVIQLDRRYHVMESADLLTVEAI